MGETVARRPASVPESACVATRVGSAPLPVPYDVSPTAYLADLHETSSIAKALHALGDPAAYPGAHALTE